MPWMYKDMVLDVEICDPGCPEKASNSGRYLTNQTKEGCLQAVKELGRPRIILLDVLRINGQNYVDGDYRLTLEKRIHIRTGIWTYLNTIIEKYMLKANGGTVFFLPEIYRTPAGITEARATARYRKEEGFVFKHLKSYYVPDHRSNYWVKAKFGWLARVKVTHVEYEAMTATSTKVDGTESAKRVNGRVTRMVGTCISIGDYGAHEAKELRIPVRFWGGTDALREQLEQQSGGQGQSGLVQLVAPLIALVECAGVDKERLKWPRFDRWEEQ